MFRKPDLLRDKIGEALMASAYSIDETLKARRSRDRHSLSLERVDPGSSSSQPSALSST